jgi:hypothetical protein
MWNPHCHFTGGAEQWHSFGFLQVRRTVDRLNKADLRSVDLCTHQDPNINLASEESLFKSTANGGYIALAMPLISELGLRPDQAR